MRILMCVMLVAVSMSACSTMKHMAGMDQCTAPTPREAKITKKVWM